jgi:hypothetical protein
VKIKGFDKILISTIAVILIGSVICVLLAVALTNTNKQTIASNSPNPPLPQSEYGAPGTVLSTITPTVTPTSSQILTPTPKNPTTPQTTPASDVTIITPSGKAGEKILAPFEVHVPISVLSTLETPIASLQKARTAVFNDGMSWALGGTFNGKIVTLTAVFGLVTLGAPNNGGNKQGWLGPQNINIPTCSSDGKCIPSDTTLAHIENRPMWVLDFGNTDQPAAGQACFTTPCPTPQIFNHSVYTIDDQSGAIITIDFYTS